MLQYGEVCTLSKLELGMCGKKLQMPYITPWLVQRAHALPA